MITGHFILEVEEGGVTVSYEPPLGSPFSVNGDEPVSCCAKHQKLRFGAIKGSDVRVVVTLIEEGECPADCEYRRQIEPDPESEP